MNEKTFAVGDHVKCWGIVGGPMYGKIIRKGKSKDCWVVKCKIKDWEDGDWRIEELNEDYLEKRQ